MKSLEARKEKLLMACSIQREMLGLEWEVLRLHTDKLRRRGQQAGDLWKWAAPLGGLLMAKRFQRTGRLRGLGSLKWVVAWKILQWWWKQRRERQRSSAPDADPT